MSIANKFNIPEALLQTIKNMNEGKEEYQAKVKALMAKRGIKSLADLSPEEKKDFFNTLDSMHKAKNEEVELDEAINHLQMAKHHQALAKEHDRISDAANRRDEPELSDAHGHQSDDHQNAAKAHLQAHKTGNPKDVAAAKKATRRSLQTGSTPGGSIYHVGKYGDDSHKDYNYSKLRSGADAIKKGLKEEVELDEGKSGTGYELYHKDFSSAMQHAYDFAKKKYNIEIDPTEIDRNVAMGPRKPGSGKANAYRLLDKTGKKAIQVQVANLDNKRYELNMYKEEVEFDEEMSHSELADKHHKRFQKHYHTAIRLKDDGLEDRANKHLNVAMKHAEIRDKHIESSKIKKEEVELDEVSPGLAKKVAQARDRSAVANRLTPTQSRRLKMKDSGGEPFMNAAQALKSAMKRGAKNVYGEEVELEESKLTLDNILSKGEQINDRIKKHIDAADFHKAQARKVDAKDPNDIEGYNRHASLTDLHMKASWSLRNQKKSPNGNHLKDYVATHKRIQDRYKKDPKLTKEEVEQVDELKVSTLTRYGTKATQAYGRNPEKDEKRQQGIQRARAKVQQKTMKKEEVEIEESDASWAKSKEMEKEKRLNPSDRDKLAKIRAMMGKEKKPMKEEFDIQEASGTEVKKDAKSQMDSAKISMQMAQLKLKQASEREALQRKKASIREEAEELDEGMSAAQIKKLRDAYGNIEKIDVSGQPYKNLVAFLDKQNLDTLKMLAGAKIKFISPLAQNRVVRKMNESIGSTVGRAIGQYAGAKMGLEGPGGAHGEILGRQLEMFARALLKKLTKEEVEEFNEISAETAKSVAQKRDLHFRKGTPTDTQKRRMGRGDWRADPGLHADKARQSAEKRGAKDVYDYNKKEELEQFENESEELTEDMMKMDPISDALVSVALGIGMTMSTLYYWFGPREDLRKPMEKRMDKAKKDGNAKLYHSLAARWWEQYAEEAQKRLDKLRKDPTSVYKRDNPKTGAKAGELKKFERMMQDELIKDIKRYKEKAKQFSAKERSGEPISKQYYEPESYNRSYNQLFAEAAKKMSKKKEATSTDNNKSVKSGDKLSGKQEPIEIDPEIKE